MYQFATSSTWMFCSTMMSPDSALSNTQLRSRAGSVPGSACWSEPAGVVEDVAEDRLADHAVVDALRGAFEELVVARLEIDEATELAVVLGRGVDDGQAPGTSTAMGLARYTCLPASSAATACSGWKYGGLMTATASTSVATSACSRRTRRTGFSRARRVFRRPPAPGR